MKTLIAILKGNWTSAERYAEIINNGRVDGTSFYVNGNTVRVSNPFKQLDVKYQEELLRWFCEGDLETIAFTTK
jgi:hypothetical protein